MQYRWLRAVLLVLAGLLVGGADQGIDVHRLFENRCGACHGHAGPFARERLVVEDGELRSRATGKDIRELLLRHRGGLNPDEADLVYDTFVRQVELGGLFQDKCAICHVRASDLAGDVLIVADGRLIGRYSGLEMSEFLLGHGRLSAAEAEILYQVLLELAPTRR